MIIATERLTLRLLTPADAAFILDLLNQPSWIRNIGDRNVHSEADAVGYIQNGPMASYARHGFGLWCVERKEDGVPIGLCGLIKRDYLDDADIGFAYLERFQGMGYGMEAAASTLAHAFGPLGMTRLAAVVNPGNAGSIRILEKLGMTYHRPILMPGETEPIAYYQVG